MSVDADSIRRMIAELQRLVGADAGPPAERNPRGGPAGGIMCPSCRAPMCVHKTRARAGRIQRRRKCLYCGCRVTTRETTIGPFTGHK